MGALLFAIAPSLTAAQAKARFMNAADYWGGGRTGNGKLNALFTLSPLEVAVSGPTDIYAAGTYTWTATASDGTGSYTYQWQYTTDGGSTWTQLGTGQTQDRYVDGSTPNFFIQATVSSGTLTRASSLLLCCGVYFVNPVNVTGPSSVGTNVQYCSWSGAVSWGTPPFIYTWIDSWDGLHQVDTTSASSDSFSDGTPDAVEQYSVGVSVTDANGTQGSGGISVTSNGFGCGS